MIERNISRDMIKQAQERLEKCRINENRNLSRFGSEKNRIFFGYLAELMVMEYLEIDYCNDEYDYDIIYREKRLEVKNISCSFKPYPNYLATVNSYDLNGVHKQKADYYVFTRILFDKTKGWIAGFIDCEDFFKKGTFRKKGTEVINDLTLKKANMTTLEYHRLIDMGLLNLTL